MRVDEDGRVWYDLWVKADMEAFMAAVDKLPLPDAPGESPLAETVAPQRKKPTRGVM